jgi:hypothetical protein
VDSIVLGWVFSSWAKNWFSSIPKAETTDSNEHPAWHLKRILSLVKEAVRLGDMSSWAGQRASMPLLVFLILNNFEQNNLQSSFNDSIIKL